MVPRSFSDYIAAEEKGDSPWLLAQRQPRSRSGDRCSAPDKILNAPSVAVLLLSIYLWSLACKCVKNKNERNHGK